MSWTDEIRAVRLALCARSGGGRLLTCEGCRELPGDLVLCSVWNPCSRPVEVAALASRGGACSGRGEVFDLLALWGWQCEGDCTSYPGSSGGHRDKLVSKRGAVVAGLISLRRLSLRFRSVKMPVA